jgi:hypothetical protein
VWQVGGKAYGIDHLPSNRAWLSPLCHNYYSSPQSTQDIAHTLKLMTKPVTWTCVIQTWYLCAKQHKKHVTVHDTTRKQLSTGVKDMKPCSTHGKENGYCINLWAGCVCVLRDDRVTPYCRRDLLYIHWGAQGKKNLPALLGRLVWTDAWSLVNILHAHWREGKLRLRATLCAAEAPKHEAWYGHANHT